MSFQDAYNPLVVFQTLRTALGFLQGADLPRFWFLSILRVCVNLMDLVGVALLAIAVNFLISAPGDSNPLSALSMTLGLHLDERGSKLPSLLGLGIVVLLVFAFKSTFSLLLYSRVGALTSKLETKYSREWMATLTQPRGTFNAMAFREEIAHTVTVGSHALFQRTLLPIGTLFSESASLFLAFLVLFFVQPTITLGILIYFGLIALGVQRFVSKRILDLSIGHADSQIEAARLVRESLDNEVELFLSGRAKTYVKNFATLKEKSSRSLAKVLFLSAMPRHIIESALILGGFGLAGVALVLEEPLQAATTVTFFLTSAMRLTPNLLNVMDASATLKSSRSELERTKGLLKMALREVAS